MVASSKMDPAPRPRFVVVYRDRKLPLPDGEFIVGRGLGCHIRFNAAEVSRQHVRLRARGGRLTAENLSSTTGTMLNGRRMSGAMSLSHGDELALGPRRLRIEVTDVVGAEPPTAADDSGDEYADEATRPGDLGDLAADLVGGVTPSIEFHTCPRCRTRVDFNDAQCGTCGYAWSEKHPSAVTARITRQDFGPPPSGEVVPLVAEVPVVYASDELTLDAIVNDLDLSRAFVPSALLDPNNTSCELTLLPEGIHAMTLSGVVASVRAIADANGPAGMTVRFTDVPPGARDWIQRWIEARKR